MRKQISFHHILHPCPYAWYNGKDKRGRKESVMTEKERMLSETLYIPQDEELAADCARYPEGKYPGGYAYPYHGK
jgi:hypothetical protein